MGILKIILCVGRCSKVLWEGHYWTFQINTGLLLDAGGWHMEHKAGYLQICDNKGRKQRDTGGKGEPE